MGILIKQQCLLLGVCIITLALQSCALPFTTKNIIKRAEKIKYTEKGVDIKRYVLVGGEFVCHVNDSYTSRIRLCDDGTFIFGYWFAGVYKVTGNRIIADIYDRPQQMWRQERLTLKILDKQSLIIENDQDFDGKKFVPYCQQKKIGRVYRFQHSPIDIDPDIYYHKKKKWLWEDIASYRNWKKSIKHKKKDLKNKKRQLRDDINE